MAEGEHSLCNKSIRCFLEISFCYDLFLSLSWVLTAGSTDCEFLTGFHAEAQPKQAECGEATLAFHKTTGEKKEPLEKL